MDLRHWTFARAVRRLRRPGGRLRRELARLAIAACLLLIATASSTLNAPLLRADAQGGTDLLLPEATPRWWLLRRPSLATGRVPDSATAATVGRLLGGLQPHDAAVHLGGIEPLRWPAEAPFWLRQWEAEEPAVRQVADVRMMLRERRGLSFGWRTVEDSMRIRRARLEATPSVLPTRGYISSGFTRARWHPILETARAHRGLDIVAPQGTPIVAAAAGRVRFVGNQAGYGLTVEVDHGYGVMTRYAHASRAYVRRGQLVTRGDTIARVGRSGLAIGSHLHYEVLVHGRPANPNRYIFDLNVLSD